MTPERRAGGASTPLIIGVLILLGAVTGLVLSSVARPSGAVPAAELTSPRPTRSAPASRAASPTPAPSARPTATPLAASPSPVVTPPIVDLGPMPDDPANAFAWRMLRGDAAYHLAVDGTFTVATERGRMSFEMDVAGSDAAGSFTFGQQGMRVRMEVIVKDGVQYTRFPGEGWVREEGFPQGMPTDLFSLAEEAYAGLEYVGPVKRGGKKLHHLRLPLENLESLTAAFMGPLGGGIDMRSFSYDIFVTGDGKPRSARTKFDGTVSESGIEMDMAFDFEYRFSRWGDEFIIDAPADYTDIDRHDS